MKRYHRFLCACALACFASSAAGEITFACSGPIKYRSAISEKDLRNASGSWLDTPGSIVRQDRANYHKFSRSDPKDEGDSIFFDSQRRGDLERAVDRAYPFDADHPTGSYNDLVEYFHNADIGGALIEVTFWQCENPPRATVTMLPPSDYENEEAERQMNRELDVLPPPPE